MIENRRGRRRRRRRIIIIIDFGRIIIGRRRRLCVRGAFLRDGHAHVPPLQGRGKRSGGRVHRGDDFASSVLWVVLVYFSMTTALSTTTKRRLVTGCVYIYQRKKVSENVKRARGVLYYVLWNSFARARVLSDQCARCCHRCCVVFLRSIAIFFGCCRRRRLRRRDFY